MTHTQRNPHAEGVETRRFGTFLLGHDPAVVRVAAAAGLDFVVLDAEHGTYPVDRMTQFIDAAQGIDVFVRCPVEDALHLAPVFDHGLTGVIVAGSPSPEDIARVMDRVKFPPQGHRGSNPFVAAAGFGRIGGAEFAAKSNADTQVWVMAESRAQFEALPQYCDIPGVSGVFLGPYDLSVDLGVPGQMDHPAVTEALGGAIRTVREQHLPVAIFARDGASARAWLERGVTWVALSADWGLLAESWRRMRATAQGIVGKTIS
ncbi:HpcH/HpaI aldolase family protein [Alicyclobacillus macrosporangiidus]|uniref:HpcH/HpaI aldolase family protein n=1 Tax=Alicyclobacillus macrosporangiidus TaxID=392015 RepID=UPI0004980145|nr:aldolase/citrate lyase family protein [Alicyclobacillus macrosporangiidus]